MPTIPSSMVLFFQDLAQNNNQEWFDANQSRYEAEVKAPFLALAQALWPTISDLESDMPSDPAPSLMPMRGRGRTGLPLMIRANFMPEPAAAMKGNRRLELPGYYLGIGPEEIHVGGGLFTVPRNNLNDIRRHIKGNAQQFQELSTDATFVSEFGGIQGEKVRRAGAEFDVLVGIIPEITNKEFYYMRGYRTTDLLDMDGVEEVIAEHYRQIAPLNKFFRTALIGEESGSGLKFGSGFFRLSDD